MKVLVDTHVFFWWVMDKPNLSDRARALLVEEENEVFVSAVVAWELATKARLDRWPEALALATDIASVIDQNSFRSLNITIEHARMAGLFAWHHRDPFDRLLAAQSQIEGILLVSADPVFRRLGMAVMW